MPLINRNPNATNSELDAKQIVTNKELNPSQRSKLIEQYSELVVDNMDIDSLVQYAQEQLANYYDQLSNSELKEQIINTHEEELYDELVDNVTQQYPKQDVKQSLNQMETFIPGFHD